MKMIYSTFWKKYISLSEIDYVIKMVYSTFWKGILH